MTLTCSVFRAFFQLLTENTLATFEGGQKASANSADIRIGLRPDKQILIEDQ
jgi:hypothetical protein